MIPTINESGNCAVPTAEWARWYLDRSINPIPIPFRSKNPNRKNWPQERYSENELESAFNTPGNVGLLLGENGCDLTDIDLDCDEAVSLAQYFLPETGWRIGRSTRPNSHWLYRCPKSRTVKFSDPLGKRKKNDKSKIVELLSTGAQVLSAPSIHPDDGQAYNLQSDGDIAEIDFETLYASVRCLAATALLARHWPGAGTRHDTTLAVAGVLLTSGVTQDWAEYIVYHAACASGDDELKDRREAVRTTIARLSNGGPVTSWSEAEKHIDRRVLEQSVAWLTGDCSGNAAEDDARPEILVTTDEHVVVDQVIDALRADPLIYQRGGALVHVVREETKPDQITRPDNTPRITLLPLPRLRERITASVRLIERKQYKDGPKDFPSHPRPWLPQAVASRGSWSGIRPLEGIVQIPVLRRDGTILTSPGYDEATGLLYEPVMSAPISAPDSPTQDDARRAVQVLWDVVSDFPFADSSRHFSAWLAAVLTPFARFAFDGPAPLFLCNGNTPGSGKGLLIDVASEIAVGRGLARLPYSSNDDEMRKRITSLAVAGETTVLLDNIDTPLGGASLDAALTAGRWEDRILSTNTVFSGQLRATWYATGNNVELTGDTPRRVLEIKLQTPLENPEERQGFRYPDLQTHVRLQRAHLVQAALTILRGYVVAGRPSCVLTPWGSFESWSNLIRNTIIWCGQADPGEARMTKVALANQDVTVLSRMIAGLEQADPYRQGMTTAQIAHMVSNNVYQAPVLVDVVGELAGEPSGAVNKKKLGKRLAKLCGRVSGGLRLIREEDSHFKVSQWKVELV